MSGSYFPISGPLLLSLAFGSVFLWGAGVFLGRFVLLLGLGLRLWGAVLLLLLALVFAGLSGLRGQSIGLLCWDGVGLTGTIRIALNNANSGARSGIGLVHLLDRGGGEWAAGGAV